MNPSDMPEVLALRTGEPVNGCWPWIGIINNKGYGMLKWHGTHLMAHRVTYELVSGAIPTGLLIDHLCRVRHCVNPEHLEPVTPAENTRRGFMACGVKTGNGRKTHCPRGHVYDEANTWRSKQGFRHCRACAREKARERKEPQPS